MEAKNTENSIGLFKRLKPSEELSFDTKIVTPVVFLKEVESTRLGMHRRQEIPISFCQANVYLTSERLLFLVLYQMDARNISEFKKSNISRLAGVSGTWFEVPLSSVQQVEMRPLQLLKGKEMQEFFKLLFPDKDELNQFMKKPAVELVYDEQAATGRIKDYMQALFNLGFWGRITTKLEKSYDKLLIVGEEIVSIIPTLRTETHKK